MKVTSYNDILTAQGKIVVELEDVSWMKYQGALIPAAAMPVYVHPSYSEAVRLIKQTGALFMRYTTAPLEAHTNWWHIICRQYNFQMVSANTRSKIRRGLKRLEITKVPPAWLANNGYDCHVTCYNRYKNASPLSHDQFRSFLLSIHDQPFFEVWACFKDKQLQGYIICLVETNGVFLHTIDLTPDGLHNYATYAMIHRILENYVNGKGVPVSNGSRSISHETEIQDFLRCFNFQREYAELHVIYRPDIRVLVHLLYPLRNLLKYFTVISFVKKITSVLFQEDILRKQASVQS